MAIIARLLRRPHSRQASPNELAGQRGRTSTTSWGGRATAPKPPLGYLPSRAVAVRPPAPLAAAARYARAVPHAAAALLRRDVATGKTASPGRVINDHPNTVTSTSTQKQLYELTLETRKREPVYVVGTGGPSGIFAGPRQIDVTLALPKSVTLLLGMASAPTEDTASHASSAGTPPAT